MLPIGLPTAFASSTELSQSQLRDADLRSLPRPSRLEAPLAIAPPKAAAAAASIGIETVGDLLEHLPFRHDDRREARTVARLQRGEDTTIVVEVRAIRMRPTRRRNFSIVEATVADETGPVQAVWFNQPWLVRRLPPGTRVALHGRLESRNQFRVSEHELASGAGDSGDLASTGLVPVYPATEGLPATRLRELAHGIRGAERDVLEPLPGRMRAAECLADRAAALSAVHWPDVPADAPAGRERLAFEELLVAQLAMLRRRARRRAASSAPVLEPVAGGVLDRWLAHGLPFEPTADQRAAFAATDADLAGDRPMARLLMGEVGTGKTVVALHAMLRALDAGHQAAMMAPTETLAEQHFATLQQLLGAEPIQAALLTGSATARHRRDVLGKLGSGELGLIVGTHALIEEAVEFRSLAVVVVDEQHRFGVRQRAALDRKAAEGAAPHVLHMTATPIPRTLALTAYGDLDVTVLRELPKGRRPIATHVCSSERERERAYERIREELRAGRQAYVVCPLVEGSEAIEARAATEEHARLRATELADFEVELLHGQMSSAEKQEAMRRFAAGEAHVLVATTVIEVGIDVPNATVMLVEGAERFGISQLHQLRGRVGRGSHDSLCLLFGPRTSARLRALAEHSDGFRLAEIDLELRGEGELIGTRQSGMAQFRVAQLPEDQLLLVRARAAAERIVADDPELAEPQHALLALALERAYGEDALAPIPG